ncbi:hypothetical protein [Erythrobacter sp. JK5]|uniref:hypothetical protein n=1 Tax=Erythrobacter sp. JK5 TaxID=2829500 RepID=UPI001BA9FD69|nr:hypothetical protein [Erythrobacter sp. JK5]QUL36449.1 hypothetical protein KDC96_08280 [Erythrobacter sp. JK5]
MAPSRNPHPFRFTAILIGIGLVGLLAWLVLRDGGLLNQVTEERVEDALLAKGVPVPMAACMAPQLTDRLSISQLRKLERLGPQEGESGLPASPGEALARLRRVDDDEAVKALAVVGARCGVDSLIGAVGL